MRAETSVRYRTNSRKQKKRNLSELAAVGPFRCNESTLDLRSDRRVALARRRFEARPVHDRDNTASVADKAGLLQDVRRERYATSPHAEHYREKFMREPKAVRPCAVMRGQEPPAAAFLERMEAIAGSGLRQLHDSDMSIFLDIIVERLALRHLLAQGTGPDAKASTWDLDHRLENGVFNAEESIASRDALDADGADLDRPAILHRLDE
jgi:hypothetical protein